MNSCARARPARTSRCDGRVAGRDRDEAIGDSRRGRVDEDGRRSGDLGKAARVRGDDGHVRGHGLQHRETEPLVQRRHDDGGRRRDEPGHERVVHAPDEQRARHALEQPRAPRVRRARQDQLEPGTLAVHGRPRLGEHLEVLAGRRAAGMQDVLLADPERVDGCHRGAGAASKNRSSTPLWITCGLRTPRNALASDAVNSETQMTASASRAS